MKGRLYLAPRNNSGASSAAPPDVILGYRVPVEELADSSTARRQPRCKRKNCGWLKIRMAEWEIDRFKALAQCFGVRLDAIIDWGVRDIRIRIEEEIGVTAGQAVKMRRAQRIQVGARIRAANAALREYATFTPEKN
jgi:hypothetical protein